jgi:Domain of unknown function (DUF4249)
MKKHIKFQIFMVLCALFLASCEQVIEIDLNTTDPKIVIEGRVTDQPEPFQITLNKTVNFDEPNNYPAVSGAIVTISNGTQTFDLNEVSPGVYQTATAQAGAPGRTYTLRVEAEGQVFEAQSTMPALVAFEKLQQESGVMPGGGASLRIVPVFSDPLGLGNNYRFVQWSNGQRWPNIFVLDDRNSDGLRITRPLFAPGGDLENAVGDTVVVEMQTIDRPIYKYFYALDASGGNGPNASVPGNADNNFSGGALGYFSACTVQKRQIVIQ